MFILSLDKWCFKICGLHVADVAGRSHVSAKTYCWSQGKRQPSPVSSWDSESLPYMLGQKQLENMKDNVLQGCRQFPVTDIFSPCASQDIFSFSLQREVEAVYDFAALKQARMVW